LERLGRRKIGVAARAAESDSDAVVLVMAFKLLREEIAGLPTPPMGSTRLTPVDCLSAEHRHPHSRFAPSQNELFYLAHLKSFLKAYANLSMPTGLLISRRALRR